VVGTSSAHRDAEAALSDLVAQPSVRIFSSAYAANIGLLGSLFGAGDLLLSDSLNHASLIDGCRLSRARTEVYRHGDWDHLRYLLEQHAHTARVTAVITETAFSMDGDVLDVGAIARLTQRHGAALVVDEAHALGVIGPAGAGVCAMAGVRPDVLVGGLGKAFGLTGGFLAGSAVLGRAIDNFARPFVFSTAILPPIAHAIPVATSLLRTADAERGRLARHAHRLREAGRQLAFPVLGNAPGAIVPLVLGGAEEAVRASGALRDEGFLVPAMRPPTVAAGTARLRITPTASHSDDDIDRLCAALRRVLGSPRERDHQGERDQP
jgi:7-keto-8-aminopelargonate synthetase-like enzyme